MNHPDRYDVRCEGCWQYRHTAYYRGMWLCPKRCWRKRKTIHALSLRNRKMDGGNSLNNDQCPCQGSLIQHDACRERAKKEATV